MIRYTKYIKTLVAIVLLGIWFNSEGQQKIDMESLIPPAPNASEIGKYGTIPVGTLTGIPDISFPLYEIKSGSLKLPITLSYHASGIQANQKSTDVGLGWCVMAGGTITRTVYSAADNNPYGYFNYTPPSYNTLFTTANYYTMSNYNIIGNTGYDLEPDLFAYNIEGKSGKFIYNPGQGFTTIPFDPIKIQTMGSGLNITFQITDDHGVIYTFSQYSKTTSDFSIYRNVISSWHLTSMISADFTDTISFEYETIYQEDPMDQQVFPIGKKMTTSGKVFVYGDDYGMVQTFQSMNTYTELLVKKIIFKNGYIQFNRNTIRKDNNPATKMLDEILVNNNFNQVIKKFTFNHDYFKTAPFLDNWANYRLKLTGFIESDPAENNKKPYVFDYNATPLPVYNSYNMDYWGYYNGSSNLSLIPITTVYEDELNTVSFANGETYTNNFSNFTNSWTVGNANREPSDLYMKAAILNKITYPTGGYTLFDYEPHKYLSDDLITQSVSKGGTTTGINNSTKSTGVFNFSCPSDLNLVSVNTPFVRGTLNINYSASNMTNTEYGETQLVTLTDVTTGTSQTWKHEGDLTVPLNTSVKLLLYPNHNYTLKNEIYGPSSVTIQSNLTWTENTAQHITRIGGGLRIKSIKNYSDNNVLIKEENYAYGTAENGLGIKLFNEKNFYRNYEDVVFAAYVAGLSSVCTPVAGDNTCWQRKFLGISKYNSINYLGSPILYAEVTKYEGNSSVNTGKTVYKYNITPDPVNLPAEFINSGNYGAVNNAWRQGELTSETVYKNNGSQYIPVRSIQNEYANYNMASQNSILFKQHKQFVKLTECGTYASGPEPSSTKYGQGFFVIYQYPIKTGINRRVKEMDTVYNPDDITKYITTITTYAYQNAANRYLTETSVTNSDGNIEVKRIKYPQDVSGTVATTMINKNILALPLEERTYQSISGIETPLTTHLINYVQRDNLIVRNSIQTSTGTAAPETRVLFNEYDSDGNILEQQKASDVMQSYIWDYNGQYPIAEAINAAQADIAFTSFEAEGKGNWTFMGDPVRDFTTPSGKKAYNLTSGALSKPISSGRTYIISYWRPSSLPALTIAGTQTGYPVTGRTVNGWKYFEHRVSGILTANLSGTGLIDEVRLYPFDARMKTYTYEPLVGVRSECDANNAIYFYEYDGLQRLILVKDQDKNIIKKICYNYAGQAENCTLYGNVVKSATYTKACSVGYTGSSVTYTVPANTYVATTSGAADQLALDDIAQNGQTFANANGTCTQSCSFSPYTGFSISSSAITQSGSVVSFYIVFRSLSGTTNWSAINRVATINGTCKPKTTTTLTMSESGRTWQVIITSTGAFSVQLLGGAPPAGTTSIALTGGSFAP